MKKLKIKSLKRGWCDCDVMILHASFQLLKNCVEKEKLFEHSPNYAKSKEGKIAKELYNWWEKWNKKISYSQKDVDFETKQLIRLMKIRNTLWT